MKVIHAICNFFSRLQNFIFCLDTLSTTYCSDQNWTAVGRPGRSLATVFAALVSQLDAVSVASATQPARVTVENRLYRFAMDQSETCGIYVQSSC